MDPTPKQDEPDPRSSIRHLLQPDSDPPDTAHDMPAAKPEGPMYTATTTTMRRNANGSVSSVYSGNKIRHLKKDDGVPLWRKDIQFDFLQYVFLDDKPVFHKASDGTAGHTFADIYLDAMAKSSKCSKILKDKLLTERPAALNMAMVCLLVNVGRMNTTLNCTAPVPFVGKFVLTGSTVFPEMRAQLRTYHSIPSLQAHQDPNAYKQLQDAPRLKSILKGATEDTEQPSSLDDIKAASIPRTNPVNLIFVLAQFAPRISEMHFDVPRDFFDLVMKSNLSSRSRATAFLWLMWWYLESDFSEQAALNNPYGPGRKSKPDDPNELPVKCPQFEILNDEQENTENQDTQSEIEFGELKKHERKAILSADMAPVLTGAKRSGKRGANYTNNPVFQVASEDGGVSSPSRDPNSPAPHPPPRGGYRNKPLASSTAALKTEYLSDTDHTHSVSPPPSGQMGMFKPTTGGLRIGTLLNDEHVPLTHIDKPKGQGRGNSRRQANRDGVNHTPRSYAAKQKAGATEAADTASPASTANGTGTAAGVAGAGSTTGPGGGPLHGPHGYYLPLNGSEVVPKRQRPPTSHQLAVERFRRQKVEFILDRGLRDLHQKARRERKREGTLIRTWRRTVEAMDPKAPLYDSEDEERRVKLEEMANGVEMSARAGFAMAGLKQSAWEDDDAAEWSGVLAQGLRRVKRRVLERWERGDKVVKKDREGDDKESAEEGADEEGKEEEGKEEDGKNADGIQGRLVEPSSPLPIPEDDGDADAEAVDEEEDQQDDVVMDEYDDEIGDTEPIQDEVMAGA